MIGPNGRLMTECREGGALRILSLRLLTSTSNNLSVRGGYPGSMAHEKKNSLSLHCFPHQIIYSQVAHHSTPDYVCSCIDCSGTSGHLKVSFFSSLYLCIAAAAAHESNVLGTFTVHLFVSQ